MLKMFYNFRLDMSNRVVFLLVVLCAIMHDAKTQLEGTILLGNVSGEACESYLGKDGICLEVKNCPAARELIRKRGRPKLCGYNKIDPLVCCDTGFNVISKSGKGSIANQKCTEYVKKAVPRIPTASTTPLEASGPNSVGVRPLIIGGEDALPLEFPHMAILGYGTGDDIEWTCGGSLVSEKFVLTAAHCLRTQLKEEVTFVKLGVHAINQSTPHVQKFAVKSRHPYPEYIYNDYHDIGLIELDGLANITARVKPACLQTEKEIGNHTLTATGWGQNEYAGDRENVLQKVNLIEISFEACEESYPPQRQLEKGLVDDNHLCAGGIQSRHDTCQGDSGGPLQFKIVDSRLYTIVGVTSFGKKCGILPSVYTRVSRYVQWIESIVWPAEESVIW